MRAKRKSRPGCPGTFFFASVLFRHFCRREALGKWGGSKKRKCPGPSWTTPAPWVPEETFSGLLRKRGWGNGCEQIEKVARASQTLFVFASVLFKGFCRKEALGKWEGSKKRKCPGLPQDHPFSLGPPREFLRAFAGRGGGKFDASKKKMTPRLPRHLFFWLASFF